MITYNTKDLKFHISQKYGIPESQVDESVLSLYYLIDKKNDEFLESSKQLKESLVGTIQKQDESINESLNEIRELQAKKYRSINYEDPTTAFWGNIGSVGMVSICALAAFIIFSLFYFSMQADDELIKNLGNLKSSVTVREDGYFIDQKNYTVVKGGILIKTK